MEFVRQFEKWVSRVLVAFLMIVVAAGTVELFYVLFARLVLVSREIETLTDLQGALQAGFGGVLFVIIGIELIATLATPSSDHRRKLELILLVTMIALGRHILSMDLEHAGGSFLAGLAALVVALGAGFWLVRTASTRSTVPGTGTSPEATD
ncbi:MAG: phosphate-starvation-inducible PsiE family protein [Thermoanaerobaculia bacterium]